MLVLVFKKVDLKYWYDLVLQQVSMKRKPDFQQKIEYKLYIFDLLKSYQNKKNLSALVTYLISIVSIYDFNFTKSSSNFRKNNGNRNWKNTFKWTMKNMWLPYSMVNLMLEGCSSTKWFQNSFYLSKRVKWTEHNW